jgi:hypothetical protein
MCSINMRCRARGGLKPYTTSRETLAITSSQPNSEDLAVCVVLVHPRVAFHPCTCGLHRGAATVVATLINYNDVKVVAETATRRQS